MNIGMDDFVFFMAYIILALWCHDWYKNVPK